MKLREIQLPDISGATTASFSAQVGSREYQFDLSYSLLQDRWFLKASELDGTVLFANRKVTPNSAYDFPVDVEFAGVLMCLSFASTVTPIGKSDLGPGKKAGFFVYEVS